MHQKNILIVYKDNHMEKELTKIFNKAKYVETPNLAKNIWQNLIIRNKNIARLKLGIFSFISLFSLIGLVPALKILLNDLTQSGIYEYLSLISSSGNSIFYYWKEFLLSIAESLPTMSIVLSLKYVAKQIIIRNQLTLSF